MLEVILSLILLSIVSVFVFRYIHIFYVNYNQTRSLYQNNIDLDKSLMVINNTFDLRVIGSAVASRKDKAYLISKDKKRMQGSVLEFVVRDQEALVGGYHEERYRRPNERNNRWIGYSGIFDFRDYNDENASSKRNLFSTPLSRLSTVDSLLNDRLSNPKGSFASKNSVRILFHEQDLKYMPKAGWYGSSTEDLFNIKCRNIGCTGNTYILLDAKDYKYFEENRLVKKAIVSENQTLYYDIVKSAVAILKEKNDLIMYYDYMPWNKQTYRDGKRNIIIKNIKSFDFSLLDNNKINISICIKENVCKSIDI